MSFSGFLFAFFRGWLLTLLILAAFPLLVLVMIVLTKAMKYGYSERSSTLGKAFAHAEQAVANISVV